LAAGISATSLESGGLDAKLNAIKADGKEELQRIKKNLLLEEVGITIEERCLLTLETI
jgi:hypothetical protein